MELRHNKENLLVEAWEGDEKVGTIITTGNIIMDPALAEEVLAEEAKMELGEVKAFIDKQTWLFAKTYANKAPH